MYRGFPIIQIWIISSSSDQQTNMDSTKSDGTSAEDAKIKSDLFNLVEKLQIELQQKNEELTKEKQEKQVFNIFSLFASL
jgi:hypothetical protein